LHAFNLKLSHAVHMQYTSPYLSLEYANAPRVFLEYELKNRKWIADHICE
jgi:hypothetical protein